MKTLVQSIVFAQLYGHAVLHPQNMELKYSKNALKNAYAPKILELVRFMTLFFRTEKKVEVQNSVDSSTKD